MLFESEPLDLKDLAIYSAVLFVVMFFCHFIPKWFGMGKRGEKYMLVLFFGLCVGVTFNMVLPGSLVIVTEAYEDYAETNSTVEVNGPIFNLARLMHGGGGEGEEEEGFRRIIGVAICTGFMILFIADYIAKELTKKKRAQEVSLPTAEEVAQEKNAYSNCGLKVLYSMFYLFASLGCMGGYLACESERQRLFILISQMITVIPLAILYGMQTKRDQTSTKKSRCVEQVTCSGLRLLDAVIDCSCLQHRVHSAAEPLRHSFGKLCHFAGLSAVLWSSDLHQPDVLHLHHPYRREYRHCCSGVCCDAGTLLCVLGVRNTFSCLLNKASSVLSGILKIRIEETGPKDSVIIVIHHLLFLVFSFISLQPAPHSPPQSLRFGHRALDQERGQCQSFRQCFLAQIRAVLHRHLDVDLSCGQLCVAGEAASAPASAGPSEADDAAGLGVSVLRWRERATPTLFSSSFSFTLITS